MDCDRRHRHDRSADRVHHGLAWPPHYAGLRRHVQPVQRVIPGIVLLAVCSKTSFPFVTSRVATRPFHSVPIRKPPCRVALVHIHDTIMRGDLPAPDLAADRHISRPPYTGGTSV